MRRPTALAAPVVAYTLALYAWWLVSHRVGDRPWWLALVNTFGLYLFTPLPLAVLLAWLSRRGVAWVAVGLALALWGLLYGELFLPRPRPSLAAATTLTVYTQNTPFPYAGGTEDGLVASLRAPGADILFLQELDRNTLVRLEQRLDDRYPHHVTAWTGGFSYAVFSRYPLERLAVLHTAVPDRPTLVALADVEGQPTVLVNLHPVATNGAETWRGVPSLISTTFRQREAQVREILDYLAGETRPVILAGDLNTTDTTTAYRLVAARYRDSWREAGFGLGHTFPAISFTWGGATLPARVVRLDYVFHSPQFTALEARTVNRGPSDHWGLVVRLVYSAK